MIQHQNFDETEAKVQEEVFQCLSEFSGSFLQTFSRAADTGCPQGYSAIDKADQAFSIRPDAMKELRLQARTSARSGRISKIESKQLWLLCWT